MTYQIDFGDGETKTFNPELSTNITISVKHQYRTAGKYNVTVTSWNQIDRTTGSCPVPLIVENPVKGLLITTNSPLNLVPGVGIFYLDISIGNLFPSNALIEWDFGDGFFNRESVIFAS